MDAVARKQTFYPLRNAWFVLIATVGITGLVAMQLYWESGSHLAALLFVGIAVPLQVLMAFFASRRRIEFDGAAFDVFDCWGRWRGRVRGKEIGPSGLWSVRDTFLSRIVYHVSGDGFEFTFSSAMTGCSSLLCAILESAYAPASSSHTQPRTELAEDTLTSRDHVSSLWNMAFSAFMGASLLVSAIPKRGDAPWEVYFARFVVIPLSVLLLLLVVYTAIRMIGRRRNARIEVAAGRIRAINWRGKVFLDEELESIEPGSMGWSCGGTNGPASYHVAIAGKRLRWDAEDSESERLTRLIHSYAGPACLPLALEGPPVYAKLDAPQLASTM